MHISEHDMVLGVDGYRGGWLAHIFNGPYADKHHVDAYTEFEVLVNTYHQARVILVDMPIGLPEAGYRQADLAARELLEARRSSLFFVPVRPTFSAGTYAQACEINQRITGKKISKQVWNITPKIREVDNLLIRRPELRAIVLEAHPELTFWALNGQRPMQHSKKTEAGYTERLQVLRRHHPAVAAIMARWGPRLPYNRDDYTDALVLAVAAIAAARRGTLSALPASPPVDSEGLPMQIIYPTLA